MSTNALRDIGGVVPSQLNEGYRNFVNGRSGRFGAPDSVTGMSKLHVTKLRSGRFDITNPGDHDAPVDQEAVVDAIKHGNTNIMLEPEALKQFVSAGLVTKDEAAKFQKASEQRLGEQIKLGNDHDGELEKFRQRMDVSIKNLTSGRAGPEAQAALREMLGERREAPLLTDRPRM